MNSPHDGLLVAIGLKPKGTRPGMPPSVRDQMMPRKPDTPPEVDGMKASPEDACFVTADKRCGDCSNWERDTQSCSKVEGSMTSGSGCAKFFAPMGSGTMPTEPDMDDAKGINAAPLGQ